MTKLVLIQAAKAALHGTFRRCGMTFTAAGEVVDPTIFSKEDWDALVSEPMLHIGPAPDGSVAVAADDSALRAVVKAAVAALEAADFGEDGLPKLAPLKKLLPPGTKGVTAALVAEVWAELQAAA